MKSFCLFCVLWLAMTSSVSSQDDSKPEGFLNIKMKTLGGKQFWTDQHYFHKWRIQENVVTGHFRLLDEHDYRHAWGNKAHCLQVLEKTKKKKRLKPMAGKCVILLHGLVNTKSKMKSLEKHFEENGYTTFNVTYASTRATIGDHAKALSNIIESLDGITEINFVCFSMGNLIVRHFFNGSRDSKTGKVPDKRIKRMVMLAPPNNGAHMATWLKNNGIFNLVTGESGKQIAVEWKRLQSKLATPSIEFGIIAGDGGGLKNPFMKGDGDFIVSIEETRLVGATDFKIVSSTHSFVPTNKSVSKMSLSFIENGYFVSKEKREPVRTVKYKQPDKNEER